MKDLRYQHKAVEKLVNETIELLSLNGDRHKLVFKAPTGSGKTVMASEMLLRLNDELRNNNDSPYSKVAYIWIAPNKLHEQSYFKMKSYFTETQELHPVVYDDIDHSINGYIKSGEILFVNWESISKDNAVMIRDTELSASLYDITRRTQEEQGLPIIVIIDEEHMFAGRIANKAEKVLQNINPKVEIRISATPITAIPDAMVNVERERVIEEEMIKEGILLNPALNFSTRFDSLNQNLIHLALEKRKELAEAYKKLGTDINPLLLIQLPNDNSEAMTAAETNIRDEVVSFLELAGITTKNGKLAIWLSAEKTNLEGIEKLNNLTEALLFKQAVALGWDCPRAAILLIFREIKSFTFTAQTVGRILRMPEQKFYSDDRLNKGYVYTNLSKDIVKIVEDDMDYITTLLAVRRENLNNVTLTSEYCERPASSRKRLGSDFKKHLNDTIEKEWEIKNIKPMFFSTEEQLGREVPETSSENWSNQQAENKKKLKSFLVFSVNNISTKIIDNLEITGEIGTIRVESQAAYSRTMDELKKFYTTFCTKLIGVKFEKVSVATLRYTLTDLLDELFGLDESSAIKVVLYDSNRLKFADVVTKALDTYLRILLDRQKKKAEKSFKEYDWEVPADRLYAEASHMIREDVKNHALMPFVELNTVSSPEKHFTAFLEKNKEYIDWWYKNGDEGRQHFSISYTDSGGVKSLFYIDFIIRMKNGQIFLFDTKSPNSDSEATAKHNALIDYIHSEKNAGKHILGGVIIEQRTGNEANWKYSPAKIENTTNITEWTGFYPDQYGETPLDLTMIYKEL